VYLALRCHTVAFGAEVGAASGNKLWFLSPLVQKTELLDNVKENAIIYNSYYG